jgi:hypothetical protein
MKKGSGPFFRKRGREPFSRSSPEEGFLTACRDVPLIQWPAGGTIAGANDSLFFHLIYLSAILFPVPNASKRKGS